MNYFDIQYREAIRRDCGTLFILGGLERSLGPGDVLVRVRLADELLELGKTFESRLYAVARRRRMQLSSFELLCPNCGRRDCPRARLLISVNLGEAFA